MTSRQAVLLLPVVLCAAGWPFVQAGIPDLDDYPAGTDRYSSDRRTSKNIAVHRVRYARGFSADFDIDADGAGQNCGGDRTCQSETSLRYPDGSSLNSARLPFFVLPGDFVQRHGVGLGDYAAVEHDGRTDYAIFGDLGPTGVLGEGSISLARGLGIDPDPADGGTAGPVVFLVFPGTRDGAVPRDAAAVRRRGRELLQELNRPSGGRSLDPDGFWVPSLMTIPGAGSIMDGGLRRRSP